MAINKNHLFEDIDGVKCAVVEAGVSEFRKDFLKTLLELNGYKVVVSEETPKAAVPSGTTDDTTVSNPQPATYKVGVTDVSFNVTNAIFGRLLRSGDGRIVTMQYWLQNENVSRDDIPYFDVK